MATVNSLRCTIRDHMTGGLVYRQQRLLTETALQSPLVSLLRDAEQKDRRRG